MRGRCCGRANPCGCGDRARRRNWALRSYTRNWRWRPSYDRARELLNGLGHSIDARRLVADLSLAERQLVEIARALAFRARLIIMDEPTAPLAEQDAAALFRTIRNLRERGVSVIFISHRLKEIFQVADRVTVLRDGKRVLTTEVAGASVDDLVRAMVGTELSAHVAPQAAAGVEGEEAIRV